MKVKKLLVMIGPSARAHGERIERIIARLRSLGCAVDIHSDGDFSDMPEPTAEMAVVFGGDGAFLGAARRMAATGIALVGVNMGRLGFLTEFSEEEFLDHADAIVAGRYEARARMMLAVRVLRDGASCFALTAMNEVSLLAGNPFRMIELSVACRGVDLGVFMGDGLIVASPTGSTGHTLSAGGPILAPSLRALILTPLAAHSLSMRPVVADAEAPVSIRVLACNEGTSASMDGQVNFPLRPGDVVEVGPAGRDLLVVQNPGRPFFSTLRTKLQWGRSPHHESDA